MILRNLVLTLAYDGTHLQGWQKTRMGRSVEEELERVLQRLLQHPITLQAASRTDAGVHARGQVVNFFTSKDNLNLDKLWRGINGLLPADITVLSLQEKGPDFHPTLHNTGKEYRYYLQLGPLQDPCDRQFRWHFPYPLDIRLMEQAAKFLEGPHDFTAFCNLRQGIRYEDHSREVTRFDVVEEGGGKVMLRVAGPNFLYRMVRNLVGTVVYVGCGKLTFEDLPHILEARDRKLAGITAPAHGLVLHLVSY